MGEYRVASGRVSRAGNGRDRINHPQRAEVRLPLLSPLPSFCLTFKRRPMAALQPSASYYDFLSEHWPYSRKEIRAVRDGLEMDHLDTEMSEISLLPLERYLSIGIVYIIPRNERFFSTVAAYRFSSTSCCPGHRLYSSGSSARVKYRSSFCTGCVCARSSALERKLGRNEDFSGRIWKIYASTSWSGLG